MKQPTTNVVRVIQSTQNTNTTVTNNVPFDGNMAFGSISNVDSVSMQVIEIEQDGFSSYSLSEHLNGTSILQVSLFEQDSLVRRQSYMVTSAGDLSKVFVLLADTDMNHTSHIVAYDTGVLTVNTDSPTTTKITRLTLL